MAALAIRLSETAPMWRHAIAPVAEWVARTLWSNPMRRTHQVAPPTRLTERHKREAKGAPSFPPATRVPQQQKLCPGCGKDIRAEVTHCGQCAIENATQRLTVAARLGRIASRAPEARAKQSVTQRAQAKARSSWTENSQPAWLTAQVYSERIQPVLAVMSSSSIAATLGVSRWYAGRIRGGYHPHPRHWKTLAALAEISSDSRRRC